MHTIPLSPVILAGLLFFFLVSGDVTASRDSPSGCNRTFNCGPLLNISYPFTGGDLPERCGLLGFRLSCVNNLTELTINSVKYRVLQLNSSDQTLSLARLDLWNETCPREFVNTTFGASAFSSGAGNVDLTMVYKCNTTQFKETPENQFECENYRPSFVDSYFLVGPVPFDPILRVIKCGERIRVPIMESIASKLLHDRSLLVEALMMGFNVSYTIPKNPNNDDCSNCLEPEQCRFDSKTNKYICVCGNRPCPVPEPKKETSKVVGLSIAGACILGMFIGGFTYYLILRRKRRAAIAKSKDLSAPPSSKSLITSSTNFSRSTPTDSYALSKSDIEKGSTYFGTEVFSYTELEEATDNFDPSKELGEGGFGTVYYGKLRDGRVVAVKRLYENNFKRVEQFMNEVKILTGLGHQNLVKLFGCTSRRSRELLLVYEFIPNGTVADHLHGKQSTSCVMSWPVRLSIAIETADALAYLHRSEIIHRDVKTNNILLDNEFRVKVADFGLSRLFPTDVTHVSTAPQGTPGYVDPEYYQCYQLTDKSDVYSFGVVLVELISSLQAVDTNRHRHDINLANMAITRIQNHAVNELVDPSLGFDKDFTIRKMTTAVAELAFRCLQQEKDMRPSMEEVVAVLRAIKNEEFIIQKADVVDIRSDDMGLLKNLPPPLSPDSVVNEKYVSNSTTPNSY